MKNDPQSPNGWPAWKSKDPNARPGDLSPPQHIFGGNETGAAPLSPLAQSIADRWKANGQS